MEKTATAMGALDAHATSLGFDNLLGEREPETGALMFLGRATVELLKFNEQFADLVGFDSDTGILDFQTEMLGVFR